MSISPGQHLTCKSKLFYTQEAKGKQCNLETFCINTWLSDFPEKYVPFFHEGQSITGKKWQKKVMSYHTIILPSFLRWGRKVTL